MTPEGTDTVLAILASASVVGRLEETSPEVWEDGLSGISDDEGIAAARQLIRTHRWVKIADILEAVRKVRDDNARHLHDAGQFAQVPDADPDDWRAYLAALRDQRTRAALGQELKDHHLELEAALEDWGPRVPEHDAPAIRRPGPLGQHCPTCRAPIGRPCKTPSGKERGPHAARQAAAGVPGFDAPVSPEQAAAEEHRRRQAARTYLAGGAA